jgi:hypothetical protein
MISQRHRECCAATWAHHIHNGTTTAGMEQEQDNNKNMVDIADLYRDDFVNAHRSIDNVKEMFKHFSHKLPTKAKEDMVHAMCSLSIAIQEAVPEILGVRFHQQQSYKIISSSIGGDK